MKIKICGLKNPQNIKQVAALKPDYMGFIFYIGSERFVGNEFELPFIDPSIKKVGVFVNAAPSYIIDRIDEYHLDMIQLHGDEKPGLCEVMSHITKVIKAFGVDETFDLKILEEYKGTCDFFLFDTKTKEYGGSGKQFDPSILEKYDNSVPFFLSGGIGLEQIERLQIGKLKNYAIDVNSRFEIKPGIKDIKELEKLFFFK